MEKLSKLRSFNRQYLRLQNCPFQLSFTQKTTQFTQGIHQFPQFTCFFLFTIVTRTRRYTELTKKTEKPDGKTVLSQRTFSSVFSAVFYTDKLHRLT